MNMNIYFMFKFPSKRVLQHTILTRIFSSNADSLVTNSLLVLTAPRFRKEEDEKAKLSGYILDENSNENSFDQQQETSSKNSSSQIFPSAILDTNDELTNLYKTISRKQILSKVQHSTFNLNPAQDNMR